MTITGKRWTPEEALKEAEKSAKRTEELQVLLEEEAKRGRKTEGPQCLLHGIVLHGCVAGIRTTEESLEIHEPKEKTRKELGEPMRIYVAGPYSPSIIKPTPTLHDASLYAQRHTDAAVAAGWVLMGRGHFPYIPHLSHYVHIQTPEGQPPLPSKWWVDFDVAFLEVCDAILMIGDWRNSRGAVSELDYAKEHGMYVFYEVDDVPDTTEMDMSTDVRFIDSDK